MKTRISNRWRTWMGEQAVLAVIVTMGVRQQILDAGDSLTWRTALGFVVAALSVMVGQKMRSIADRQAEANETAGVLQFSRFPMGAWQIEERIRAMVGNRLVAYPDLHPRQWEEAYEFLIASGAAIRCEEEHYSMFKATKPRSTIGEFMAARGILRGSL